MNISGTSATAKHLARKTVYRPSTHSQTTEPFSSWLPIQSYALPAPIYSSWKMGRSRRYGARIIVRPTIIMPRSSRSAKRFARTASFVPRRGLSSGKNPKLIGSTIRNPGDLWSITSLPWRPSCYRSNGLHLISYLQNWQSSTWCLPQVCLLHDQEICFYRKTFPPADFGLEYGVESRKYHRFTHQHKAKSA